MLAFNAKSDATVTSRGYKRKRETHRQTDRQTETDREGDRDRQT